MDRKWVVILAPDWCPWWCWPKALGQSVNQRGLKNKQQSSHIGERHVYCCRGLNCQPQRQGKKIMILIQQRTKRVPCHCQLLCFDQNPCFWGQEGSLAVGYLVSTFCPFAAQLSAIDTMLQCSVLHITRLWSCTIEELLEHFRCNLISPTAIKWGSPWPVATKLKQWLLAKQYKGEADSTALDTKQNIAWRLKKKNISPIWSKTFHWFYKNLSLKKMMPWK